MLFVVNFMYYEGIDFQICLYKWKNIEFNSDCSIQAGFCFVLLFLEEMISYFGLLKSVKWHFMRQFLCLPELRTFGLTVCRIVITHHCNPVIN